MFGIECGKTNVVMFRKQDRRAKKREIFRWKGNEIEEVREFVYVGYTLKENNSNEGQIKKIVKKANAALGRIWGIRE